MPGADLTEIRDRIGDVERDVAVLAERVDGHQKRSEERHAEVMEQLRALRDASDQGGPPRSRSSLRDMTAIGAVMGSLGAAAVAAWNAFHGSPVPIPPERPEVVVPAPVVPAHDPAAPDPAP